MKRGTVAEWEALGKKTKAVYWGLMQMITMSDAIMPDKEFKELSKAVHSIVAFKSKAEEAMLRQHLEMSDEDAINIFYGGGDR